MTSSPETLSPDHPRARPRYTAVEERARFEKYQDQASTLIRQLALAGVAVVWIFTERSAREIELPSEFVIPLALLLLSLAFDLLSYVGGAVHSLISFAVLGKRGPERIVLATCRALDKVHPQVLFFFLAVLTIGLAYVFLLLLLLERMSFR